MHFTRLGRAGVTVSRLCLGTLNFGSVTPPDEALRILDAAEEAGINFIDTANNYGGEGNLGGSETVIGDWLGRSSSRRERVVLATKVCNPMGPGPNERGLSAYHIRRACEASLRRLRTDYLDVYQMHKFDPHTRFEEVWEAFSRLITEGKIIYAGCSNFHGWQLAQAQTMAESRDLFGLSCGQSLYNLIERQLEHEIIDAYRAFDIGLLPWSPLAEGLLAGVTTAEPERLATEPRLRRARAQCEPQLLAYEQFCRELGTPPSAVALAWLLHRPGVTAPVIGPRSQGHLQEAVLAPHLRLTPEMLAALEAIWPPPERWITRPSNARTPKVEP